MGSLSRSTQLPPRSAATGAATATATNPQWMLLAPYGGGIEEDCNITGDTKTIAAAVTSNGQRITVSLRCEPCPALSRICLCFLPGTANTQSAYSTVVAVASHGGSVLLQITSTEGYRKPCAWDYFVYSNAGAADPARPPSLYLLPPYTSAKQWPPLDMSATGLVCHGEAEIVVAELKIVASKDSAAAAASPIAFELLLYRDGEWSVKRPQIIGDDHGTDGDLLPRRHYWEPQAVVPLGSGLLCWVNWHWHQYHALRGVIFSNVLDDSPVLRYVPYPAEAVNYWRSFLCTDAHGALKLVSLSPRRCSHCGCSQHATAVDAWTLNTDDMTWVLETETDMVDATELWALEPRAAAGYARVHLVYCVASTNGGGRHVDSDASAVPTEEEVQHTAGKGRNLKGNVCIRAPVQNDSNQLL